MKQLKSVNNLGKTFIEEDLGGENHRYYLLTLANL
jgi:hypothetical protein